MVQMRGALIGRDVRNSYSKKIHEALGTSYDLISIDEDSLNSFFKENDYDFINVTIPYKEKVLNYLDIKSDEVLNIGATNLIIKENGKYHGYNSDYYGFLMLLEYCHIDLNNKKVLILGTGGASKAITHALKAKNALYDYASTSGKGISYLELNKKNNDYEIIINCSPRSMYPNIFDEPLIDLDKFNNLEVVIDIIYNPRRTKLLIEAERKGIKAINGISMLVFQALYPYHNIDKEYAYKLIDILNKERNIVLIGMPYAGKSHLARKISKMMPERDLYDIDDIIIERYGSIEKIFKENGEEYFRDIEEEVIKEISLKNNAIIVTGGGFFKRENNIFNLQANGALYYLKKDLKELIKNYNKAKVGEDLSRPLIKSVNDLEKLYEERKNIYEDIKDEIIQGDFDDYYNR